jgi:hypothetical protein
MPLREWLEIGSYLVTIVTLPFAVAVFLHQQRKERDNEDEEQYQHLSDAYNDFLRVVLDNADLQLRSTLFERAYLVAYKPDMTPEEQRRWNSWDDYMREWCLRDDFHNALPQLLSGEDPAFQAYIERVAREARGVQSSPHALRGAS